MNKKTKDEQYEEFKASHAIEQFRVSQKINSGTNAAVETNGKINKNTSGLLAGLISRI